MALSVSIKKGNLTFGVKSVVAGQKGSSVSVDPQLVVLSTKGKFTITPAVSRALGLVPGDFITFFDNIDEITRAIAVKTPEIVAAFEENGLSIDDPEAIEAITNAYRTISIAKSIPQKNADGTPKMTNERMAKEDKLAYIDAHRDEIVQSLEDAGIEATEANILAAVKGDEVQAYNGSKCATTSEMTGTGLVLSFTDSNMWNVLKADVDPDEREKMKRTIKVDVKNPIVTEVNDGFETVSVPTYPLVLEEANDETVTARGTGKGNDEPADSAE